jgi:hypothetical protein
MVSKIGKLERNHKYKFYVKLHHLVVMVPNYLFANIRCVTSLKNEDVIYTAAEA